MLYKGMFTLRHAPSFASMAGQQFAAFVQSKHTMTLALLVMKWLAIVGSSNETETCLAHLNSRLWTTDA